MCKGIIFCDDKSFERMRFLHHTSRILEDLITGCGGKTRPSGVRASSNFAQTQGTEEGASRLFHHHGTTMAPRTRSPIGTVEVSARTPLLTTQGELFTDRQATIAGVALTVLTLLALALSLPYWRSLGILTP